MNTLIAAAEAVRPLAPAAVPAPVLSLVMPFYNEETAVEHTLAAVHRVVSEMQLPWELVAVNDGSRDATLERLLEAQRRYPWLVVVDLSRNFGKEAAVSCGLSHTRGQAVIPLDADLQDPPELITRFIDEWRRGAEVVVAHRSDRHADSWAKRSSAGLFYKVINHVADVTIPENVGDFRLMDRVVVDAINALPESRRFMKGLFAWAGFRTVTVDYVRPQRELGDSKFNGWRLWNLALEGITSFSTVPLRIWSYVGAVIALLGFLYAAFIVARTLIYGADVPGYASLLTIVLFLGGVQLLGLGIIGEYLGRVYMESKRRPPYVVRKVFRPPP
jgi:glycosyltransferase involved in cell wall biosynthesis